MPAALAHGSQAILSLLSRYEVRCKDVWLLPSSANKIAYGDVTRFPYIRNGAADSANRRLVCRVMRVQHRSEVSATRNNHGEVII